MAEQAPATQLMTEFRATRRRFEALVRSLDEEAMATSLAPGQWRPRDVVVQIAAWLAEAGERIPALQAGAPCREYNVEAFNAYAVAIAADWTPEQALGAYQRAADRFETLAAELDDHALDQEPGVRAWLEAAARVLIAGRLATFEQAAQRP